jgi:hypothetical protein
MRKFRASMVASVEASDFISCESIAGAVGFVELLAGSLGGLLAASDDARFSTGDFEVDGFKSSGAGIGFFESEEPSMVLVSPEFCAIWVSGFTEFVLLGSLCGTEMFSFEGFSLSGETFSAKGNGATPDSTLLEIHQKLPAPINNEAATPRPIACQYLPLALEGNG